MMSDCHDGSDHSAGPQHLPLSLSLRESDQGDKMNYCLLIISLKLAGTNWLDRIMKMKRKAGELKIPPLALCVLYYKAETHLVRLRAQGTAILPISPHFIIQRLELATWISIFWLKEDSPWPISQIGLPRTRYRPKHCLWENIQFPQSQHFAVRNVLKFLFDVELHHHGASHIILTNLMLIPRPRMTRAVGHCGFRPGWGTPPAS